MSRLKFYGATELVTGSAYLLEAEDATVLLECGLIQGSWEEEHANEEPLPFDVGALDAVILSHAHLDHSGRLPKLVAAGYKGPIYLTHPTGELLDIMLKDAAFLEERDTEWENRRRRRAGKDEKEPLFTLQDVEAALLLCRPVEYDDRFTVANGIEACFRDAGHILGSAIVEVFLNEAGRKRKLVFSGDLGNSDAALLRDPARITEADALLLESTYGDRDHRPMDATLEEFADILAAAAQDGGNVLIPAFAVGRTQEIIFHLGEFYHAGKLRQQAVYLDSPMAISATEVYQRYQYTFNAKDGDQLDQGDNGSLTDFLPPLRYSRSTEDSMALNRIEGGVIIIAGSGMCSGGRIRHHLKHNLWRSSAHVVIVGFQARGTPGRALVDGARTFRAAGEDIAVKAQIHTLGGFSAHASQSQLLRWVTGFSGQPDIHLVHGETEAKDVLRKKLLQAGRQVHIPSMGSSISI